MILEENQFDFWNEHIEISKFEKFHQNWLTWSWVDAKSKYHVQKYCMINELPDNYMVICK